MPSIEAFVFNGCIPRVADLLTYGFIQEGKRFKGRFPFMDGAYEAEITIEGEDIPEGKVFDVETGDEYALVHIEQVHGTYVGSVREQYRLLLEDIVKHCFDREYFSFSQTRRIVKAIWSAFGDRPSCPFETGDSAVFRHGEDGPWYGIVMTLSRGKLKDSSGVKLTKEQKESVIEIINVKLSPEHVLEALKILGVHPAWHMNHKHWITLRLDDTLSDEAILQYISESRKLTKGKRKAVSPHTGEPNAWLVPSNPAMYDVEAGFLEDPYVTWTQTANIAVGDLVFLYCGAPIKEVRYLCLVEKTGLPDTEGRNHPEMLLRLLHRVPFGSFSLERLKSYGVTSIRSARHMPAELVKAMKEAAENNQSCSPET